MTGGKREKKKANIEKKKNLTSSGIPNFQNSNAENNEKNPTDDLNLTMKNLQKAVDDLSRKQGDTDKINEKVLKDIREIRENQKKMEKKQTEKDSQISEKLQFICEKLEKIEKKSEESEVEKEKNPSFNSVISTGFLMKNPPRNEVPPTVGRSFVLKHVFENVSKMKEETYYNSEVEDHFGVPWFMCICKKEEYFGFYLQCNKSLDTKKWEIETKQTFKFTGVNGNVKEGNGKVAYGNCNNEDKITAWGEDKFVSSEELKKDFLDDDKLSAEIYVEMNKITGVYKENLRSFGESTKEVSDMVLVVGEQKFYVLKLYLAAHSPYFNALFFRQFQESNQFKIKLPGIEPEDFQNFLEVLYAAPSIDEVTVEGILLVADTYNTSMAIEKCEDFLLEKSDKSNKKKLQMAIRYNLDKLKKKCLSEIKTIDDIKSIISGNLEDLEPSVTTELLKKSISFQ